MPLLLQVNGLGRLASYAARFVHENLAVLPLHSAQVFPSQTHENADQGLPSVEEGKAGLLLGLDVEFQGGLEACLEPSRFRVKQERAEELVSSLAEPG